MLAAMSSHESIWLSHSKNCLRAYSILHMSLAAKISKTLFVFFTTRVIYNNFLCVEVMKNFHYIYISIRNKQNKIKIIVKLLN